MKTLEEIRVIAKEILRKKVICIPERRFFRISFYNKNNMSILFALSQSPVLTNFSIADTIFDTLIQRLEFKCIKAKMWRTGPPSGYHITLTDEEALEYHMMYFS